MRFTLLIELPNVLSKLIKEICPFIALYSNGVDLLISKTLEVSPFSSKYYKARFAEYSLIYS